MVYVLKYMAFLLRNLLVCMETRLRSTLTFQLAINKRMQLESDRDFANKFVYETNDKIKIINIT